MDTRASMRALLENARESIRSRAANAAGARPKAKAPTLAASSARAQHHKPQASAESRAADLAEGLHFQKDTTSGAEGAAAAVNAPGAADSRMQFVEHYYRLLSAFIEDKSKYELEVPNLSGLDRMVVHALAEKCNLSHESAGARSERVMHLKKDILFFQHPEAAQQVNLEEIIEKVSWKESKYQIRYVRSANPAQVAVGEIGSYADEDALQKIERFRRATDEYRHTSEMGYTQQELLLAESGEQDSGDGDEGGEGFTLPGKLEEILSRPDPVGPAITTGPSARSPDAPLPDSPSTSSSAESTAARAMRAAAAGGASGVGASGTLPSSLSPSPSDLTRVSKAPVTTITIVYDEVCRACGSRVRLDGPPQGWKCSHYCANCTRQTIWSLEEVKIQETKTSVKEGVSSPHKRGRDGTHTSEKEQDAKPLQRPRHEPAVEEIDKEDGDAVEGAEAPHTRAGSQQREGHSSSTDDEEEDGLAVEDIMEVAATNDFSAKDINWLRAFASRANARVSAQIAFCIDFSDLADMPIFRRYDKEATPNEPSVWYVVLREVRDLSVSVTDLLRELLKEAFASASSSGERANQSKPGVEEIDKEDMETLAMEHVGVAFPNLSVYGTECVAVCQLRPKVRSASLPKMPIQTEALKRLRQKHGERHVFPTQSLQEAVTHAAQHTAA